MKIPEIRGDRGPRVFETWSMLAESGKIHQFFQFSRTLSKWQYSNMVKCFFCTTLNKVKDGANSEALLSWWRAHDMRRGMSPVRFPYCRAA